MCGAATVNGGHSVTVAKTGKCRLGARPKEWGWQGPGANQYAHVWLEVCKGAAERGNGKATRKALEKHRMRTNFCPLGRSAPGGDTSSNIEFAASKKIDTQKVSLVSWLPRF